MSRRLKQLAAVLNPLDNGGFLVQIQVDAEEMHKEVCHHEAQSLLEALLAAQNGGGDNRQVKCTLYAENVQSALAQIEEAILGRVDGRALWS